MQVMEFSKGSGSALAVTLPIDNPEALNGEFRQVKAAILDWRAKHGPRCEMVMLTVVSAPEHHSDIESIIEKVYREEAELAPILQSLKVQIALLNSRGKPVKEYAFEKTASEQTAKPKPWWKFW